MTVRSHEHEHEHEHEKTTSRPLVHLGASDGREQRIIAHHLHRGQRRREGGPARARVKLGRAAEEGRGTTSAGEGACTGLPVERRRVGLLGATLPQDEVLLAGEDVCPLALRALDGVAIRP